ncbi:MAG: hypothetical protein ACYS7Y_04080 [Planctomycetota bacterium]|jgi:hypothetical protein
MACCKITNVTSKESQTFIKLKRVLQDKSYMKFQVSACPVGGSFDVMVETAYDTTDEELKDFLLYILAEEVAK